MIFREWKGRSRVSAITPFGTEKFRFWAYLPGSLKIEYFFLIKGRVILDPAGFME
jgi:hypothetical protein